MSKQIRILILEDNASDAELVQLELRRAGLDLMVQWAQDKASFLHALDESVPDLVLADYSLPGFDGIAAIAMARERYSDMPVIIVSGAIGEETAIEALKAGATDYVLKQRLGRLGPVVERALREAEELVERKRTEDALRESQERYRTLFNTLLEGFCIIEMVFDADNRPVDYRFLEINPAFEEQTGLHEAQGKLMREFAPDHEQHWFDIYGRIALTGEPARFVNEAQALGRWFDVSAYRVGGQESRKVGILFSDITEQKLAEGELAKSKVEAERRTAQLESFISSMEEGVALLDADGNTILVNDMAKAILGCPPGYGLQDWACQSQWYALDGELVSLAAEDIPSSRALRGEVVKDARYRVVPRLGKEAIVNASASPVRDSQGVVIGAVSVFHDVADRVEFERARRALYEKEHHIAEMLQQTLIPSAVPREIQGISIAVRYKAALDEAQVGGDFYDVFELGEHMLGVLIGDVAGKGLQAAIRVAAVRYSVRGYAYLEPSPGRVLTLVNQTLGMESADVANVLTAFFAVVDTNSGTMTYACAGHEPPVVCSAGNDIVELAVTGAMLGVIKSGVYSEGTYKLSMGDTVVMFTDGITEARSAGPVLFQKSGVIEHLKRTCSAGPEEVAEALLNAAVLHAGGILQDDAAIVVLGLR
jgi:PAS domain S-box-containing protein